MTILPIPPKDKWLTDFTTPDLKPFGIFQLPHAAQPTEKLTGYVILPKGCPTFFLDDFYHYGAFKSLDLPVVEDGMPSWSGYTYLEDSQLKTYAGDQDLLVQAGIAKVSSKSQKFSEFIQKLALPVIGFSLDPQDAIASESLTRQINQNFANELKEKSQSYATFN